MILTEQEVINMFREVHGDLYDYSKVVYVDNKTKVCITHPIYGDHWITPNNHKNGRGHRKQAIEDRRGKTQITTEEIIRRFIVVHGDLYDYSKAVYFNARTKLIIIHPEFGEHLIMPGNHLAGHDHPKVGFLKLAEYQRLSTEEFIEKARLVHGDLYDYSKAVYVDSKTKLIIIHPEFGEHLITPGSHYNGAGHPKVGDLRTLEKLASNIDEFIEKSRLIHGDTYDYSKAVYVNAHTKLIIIHPEFGDHPIIPMNHLKGCGHPSASPSGFKPDKPGRIYVYHIHELNLLKFGITNKTVKERTRHKYEYTVLIDSLFDIGQHALDIENDIKKNFDTNQSDVVFDGSTETLKYSDLDELMEFIEKKAGTLRGVPAIE